MVRAGYLNCQLKADVVFGVAPSTGSDVDELDVLTESLEVFVFKQ
jgi:hypothetical protein